MEKNFPVVMWHPHHRLASTLLQKPNITLNQLRCVLFVQVANRVALDMLMDPISYYLVDVRVVSRMKGALHVM